MKSFILINENGQYVTLSQGGYSNATKATLTDDLNRATVFRNKQHLDEVKSNLRYDPGIHQLDEYIAIPAEEVRTVRIALLSETLG